MELQDIIGYSFRDESLLKNALTHSSYSNENREKELQSNERLEFLGDSVLGMIVAEQLFRAHPDMPEGNLTRLRAALVCEENLAETARDLKLGDYLLMGKGEAKGNGRARSSITADAVEAILAAIYLDGGRESAEKFVRTFILDKQGVKNRDNKTLLQEYIQREKDHVILYEAISESGPPHDRRFDVRVLIDSVPRGEGSGHSKKDAEQEAARQALQMLAPQLL